MNHEIQYIGKEWISGLPKNWKFDRIKDVCENLVGGGTPKTSESEYWEDGDIIWLSPTDFSRHKSEKYIYESEKKITKLGLESSSATMIPFGTIVMSSRASIGEAKIAGCDLSTNQGFISFIVNYKMHNNFLYYAIEGHLGKYFNSISSGTTFNEISRRIVKQEQVPVPTIQEQKVIADYLDIACARIDRIISIKEAQLEKIKEIRKSKIDEFICLGLDIKTEVNQTGLSYLPKIKDGWLLDRFKDVAKIRDEKTDEKSEIEDYIELEDIDQGTGQIFGKRNTIEVESKVTKFFYGDVLFGKLRPYLEKYHYAEFDGKCTGEILAFKPERINGKFLMYILGSKWFIDLCNSMSYGAKMPRVNWNTQLAMINLPLPSKTEQQEIVEQLDNLSQKVQDLKRNVTNQIETLKSYRKSLIHECVTGKKQVAEPTNKN